MKSRSLNLCHLYDTYSILIKCVSQVVLLSIKHYMKLTLVIMYLGDDPWDLRQSRVVIIGALYKLIGPFTHLCLQLLLIL